MRASSGGGDAAQALLAATPSAVYRIPATEFDDPERVLDAPVYDLAVTPDDTTALAATADGTYRTADGGETWQRHGLAGTDVRAVEATTEAVYAGTRPANLHVGDADSADWRVVREFREELPTETWPTNPHREEAWVRTVGVPAGAPATLVTGVEVGGLAVSRDRGESWATCPAVPDDVHDVTCVSATEWVVSCGTGGPEDRGGVFRTTTAGTDWERLDTGDRDYARASCHGSRLHAAANRSPPLWEPPDAAVFVADDTGRLERVEYPGEPTSFVISWTTADGWVFAGTNDGRVLRRRDDGTGWRRLGRLPVTAEDQRTSGVRSMVRLSSSH